MDLDPHARGDAVRIVWPLTLLPMNLGLSLSAMTPWSNLTNDPAQQLVFPLKFSQVHFPKNEVGRGNLHHLISLLHRLFLIRVML